MKVLQINTTVNTGSTGKITEGIGQQLINRGHDSSIAYGRRKVNKSESKLITIGSKLDQLIHGLHTRILDRHGFASKKATTKLIQEIEHFNPDAIGLHNLHGYYLNIEVLFNFLSKFKKPVVWTFHDCWPFTGHCAFYDSVQCKRWQDACFSCPKKKSYPSSYFLDQSTKNFLDKKKLFNQVKDLQIITPSHWLKNEVNQSFLSGIPCKTIHNGIDLEVFYPREGDMISTKYLLQSKKVVLGVANIWSKRKGLGDFLKLAEGLPEEYQIILLGLNKKQINKLPDNIIGITRTESVDEMVSLYNIASVFVNPTIEDNFPTTNIEALACGTPVITYNTGGSPEAIDEETGKVVEKGDVKGLWEGIQSFSEADPNDISKKCRERAERYFDREERFKDYVELYEKIV